MLRGSERETSRSVTLISFWRKSDHPALLDHDGTSGPFTHCEHIDKGTQIIKLYVAPNLAFDKLILLHFTRTCVEHLMPLVSPESELDYIRAGLAAKRTRNVRLRMILICRCCRAHGK